MKLAQLFRYLYYYNTYKYWNFHFIFEVLVGYPKFGFQILEDQCSNGLNSTWNSSFFLPNFGHIWWFFKVKRNIILQYETWKNLQIWQKFRWKKMKKILVQFVFNKFIGWVLTFECPQTRFLGTPDQLEGKLQSLPQFFLFWIYLCMSGFFDYSLYLYLCLFINSW